MPTEDLQIAQKFLKRALRLREKYMKDATQYFPDVTKRFIHHHLSQDVVQTNPPENGECSRCLSPLCLLQRQISMSPHRRPLWSNASSFGSNGSPCKGIHLFAVEKHHRSDRIPT